MLAGSSTFPCADLDLLALCGQLPDDDPRLKRLARHSLYVFSRSLPFSAQREAVGRELVAALAELRLEEGAVRVTPLYRSARGEDQPEAVTADAIHVRVDDGDRRRGGDGGVHGVAATAEDGAAGLGGEPMGRGDHAACRTRFGPAGGGGHAAHDT